MLRRRKIVTYYAAVTVLLTLLVVVCKFLYLVHSRDLYFIDAINDDQLDTVLSRKSTSETMVNREKLETADDFTTVPKGIRASSYISSDKEGRPKVFSRYVLAWNYWEQLTMATNNMFSLLWFSNHWNAPVVVPFTRASRLYGLWKRWDNMTTLPLYYLYNHSQLNGLLEEYKLLPLVSMEEFLSMANRSFIMIQLFYYGDIMPIFSTLGGSKAEVISRLEKEYVVECSDTMYMKNISSAFLKTINERAANKFSVKACYCVNASHAIYPDKLAEITGIDDKSEVSVVFNNWRGVSGSDVVQTSPQGKLKNFRMFVPGSGNAHLPHPYTVVFPYGMHVKRSAMDFVHSLTNGTVFGVVHFRSEKLGQRDKRMNGFFAKCWEKVINILQSDILLKHPNITVLYFTDYGLLGSNTCLHNCRGAEITNAALAKNGLTVSHFDPTKFNAPLDSGFVALVEQSVMAMSQFLVLVGGGSFQTQIRQQFKSQPTAENGYAACWEDEITVKTF